MSSNNKLRLLALIEILRSKTDMDHKLSLSEIVSLLQAKGIEIQNRKTLYDDFDTLNQANYIVEYDNGYYLQEAPFSLSEVKIIIDSLNSLKNLDDKLLNNITKKLYSFISDYEANLLDKLHYHNKHSDSKFINRLEDVLFAIKINHTITIKRNDKKDEEIAPIFLYRQNDYYYLYYTYINNSKIYHTRFDNISSIKISDNINDTKISKNDIIETINASTNAFYSNKAESIRFIIIDDSAMIRQRLQDDFPNIILTKNGFNIKASVNNVFFSKIAAYGDQIKIDDKQIANQYIKYLNSIITRNKG